MKTVKIRDEIHRELKIRAAIEHVDIQEFVERELLAALKKNIRYKSPPIGMPPKKKCK